MLDSNGAIYSFRAPLLCENNFETSLMMVVMDLPLAI